MPRPMPIQEKIEALRRFHRQEGRAPGYAEMLALFKYRSKNAVHGLLKKLAEHGLIRKSPAGKIALTPRLTGSVRLLGAVQAGFPSPAEEELADTLTLDEFLIRRPEATYMLTVTGDSMTGAGIRDGDLLVVDRSREAKSGSIVVAVVDGALTVKRLRVGRQGVRLEPENPAYKPIVVREDAELVIWGVVAHAIRSY